MKIRIAKTDDNEYMAECLVDLCLFKKNHNNDPYSDVLPSKINDDIRDYTCRYIEVKESFAIIAENEGQKIGCCYGRIQESQLPVCIKEKVGFVSVAWADSHFDGQNTAQKMFKAFEFFLLTNGVQLIELSYMTLNFPFAHLLKNNDYLNIQCFAYKRLVN